jgi:hypothetical protein
MNEEHSDSLSIETLLLELFDLDIHSNKWAGPGYRHGT